MKTCPLCNRELILPSDHHLKPKCRGGKRDEENMLLICRDCHDAVHALFSNKQLESEFDSVEALMANERFAKTVKFISKQDPGGRTKTKRSNDKRRRRGNG